MTRYLHVSIGPVQTFVKQSRRTRDLWASSYLLSVLSANAMHRAVRAGGVLINPKLECNPLWRWLDDRTRELPETGSVPNQFTIAIESGIDGVTLAAAAKAGFQEAWDKICLAVRDRYLAAATPVTRTIWDRQVTGFWELVWIVDVDVEPRALTTRKRWRTLEFTEEPGDKCTVIPMLQELSGEIRSRGTDARLRQERFWSALGAQPGVGTLDVDRRERLSAIALIKRLFPRVAASALGKSLDRVSWPSTVELAALPWCQRAVDAAPELARAYASRVTAIRGEAYSGGLAALVQSRPSVDVGPFRSLDANWFHSSYLRTVELDPPLSVSDREELGTRLMALHEAVDAHGEPLGAPPIYYALLLADGDRIGALRAALGADRISNALQDFSESVGPLIAAHRGVTVYAGGDDVLALLPLDRALACAAALEARFREAFDAPQATLSASVVLAHARAPLDQVIDLAHELLDDIAKDENGRSSVVVAVARHGEMALQWVTTWGRGEIAAVPAILELAAAMAGGALSTAVVHSIGDLLRRLGCDGGRPGHVALVGADLDLAPLVRSAVLASLAHREVEDADGEAERLTSMIEPLLRPARRTATSIDGGAHEVSLDGLLVARFLAGAGREGEHEP